MRLALKTATLLLACAAMTTAEQKRPIVPADYYALDVASDPQISPDGKLVAYVVTSIDQKQNRRRSEIWIVPFDGSAEPWPLTNAESSNSPRWSPDGRSIAFLSARHDPQPGTAQRAQLFIIPLRGGEPRRVTELKNGVTAFRWSPDGARVACVSKIGPSDNLPANKDRSDVRDYTLPSYKLDGVGYYDDRHAHLWMVDVQTAAARQITFGENTNDSEPQWSPDGSRIAFMVERTDLSMMRDSELHIVDPASGKNTRVAAPEVFLHTLRWSHDGKKLAYIGSSDEITMPKLFISNVDTGTFALASESITYATELDWTDGDRALFYVAAERGEHLLYRLDLASRQGTPLRVTGSLRTVSFGEGGRTLAYAGTDDVHPGDIFAMELPEGSARQLTHLSQKLLAALGLQRMERLPFKGADDWPVEGFFMKPAGWQAGKTYPMMLMIHGGPNGMWGPVWNLEAQSYAARGWAVLLTNPRGSSGYGEAFQRGVDKEWGGKAYRDVMAGVDAALAKYSWVDKDRLGLTGQSFGGFMTDWVVGQTTRFKAAITLSGISDMVSIEGVRDAYYGHSRDFGGDLWENFDLYWKYSPIRNAKNVKTPTLILHGEADHRVPLEQGEEFFRALSHFGVPTELVIFPREPHSLRSEPKHAVEVLEWQIYWFDRYAVGNASAVKPNAKADK
jgi:dipeptidyl aminopeptidase/acylaminoacyl peptidase